MERRDFVINALRAGLIMIIPLSHSACGKDEDDMGNGPGGGGDNPLTIDLSTPAYSSLATSGGYAYAGNIIVANTSSGFVALSSVCTHEGCTITFSSSANNFPCPCHGSVFSTSGSVVTGPASMAVRRYNVTQQGSILTIS